MKKVFAILVAAVLSFSCGPAGKIGVVDAGEPVFNGLTSIHGKADVLNLAKKDLVIENAVLNFRYKERELASARLMRPVEITAQTLAGIRYDMKLESESLSDLQTLRNRMQTNPAQVFIDVTANVRYGNVRKRIVRKNIRYIEIITNFGTSE